METLGNLIFIVGCYQLSKWLAVVIANALPFSIDRYRAGSRLLWKYLRG